MIGDRRPDRRSSARAARPRAGDAGASAGSRHRHRSRPARARPTRSPTSPASASATRRSIRGDGPLVVGEGPVRTGVTMIVPHDGDIWTEPVFAGSHRLNGNGELTGPRVDPRGRPAHRPDRDHEHPLVGVVRDAIIRERGPDAAVRDVVLGAAGRRRDVGRPAQRHRRLPRDGRPRRRGARRGDRRAGRRGQRRRRDRDGLPRVQGRDRDGVAGRRRRAAGGFTVGVLVQANYGRRELAAGRRRAGRRGDPGRRGPEPVSGPEDDDGPSTAGRPPPPGSGSIIVIVATDAPLLPHQCERLAQRAGLGIARMGGTGAHSSGDLFLCFATGNRALPRTSFRADPRVVVDVRALNDFAIGAPVRRDDRGDRGGDPQRARRRRDDDRPRRHHGHRAAARPAARDDGPVRPAGTRPDDRG